MEWHILLHCKHWAAKHAQLPWLLMYSRQMSALFVEHLFPNGVSWESKCIFTGHYPDIVTRSLFWMNQRLHTCSSQCHVTQYCIRLEASGNNITGHYVFLSTLFSPSLKHKIKFKWMMAVSTLVPLIVGWLTLIMCHLCVFSPSWQASMSKVAHCNVFCCCFVFAIYFFLHDFSLFRS